MKYSDIRRYLKPYSIVASRTTTINHAFAAAIAPCDAYDEKRIRRAITLLCQDPNADLQCAYCGKDAETWDHVHATVRDKKFSGYGHRIGNLLPCCKQYNSKKGNKDWQSFLNMLQMLDSERKTRQIRIEAYLEKTCVPDPLPKHLPEYDQLQAIREQVLELFRKADALAAIIRGGSGAA